MRVAPEEGRSTPPPVLEPQREDEHHHEGGLVHVPSQQRLFSDEELHIAEEIALYQTGPVLGLQNVLEAYSESRRRGVAIETVIEEYLK